MTPQPSSPNRPPVQRLLGCCVRVTTRTGRVHEYKALAASTIAAVMDALAMFGPCKVSACALYPNAWLDAGPDVAPARSAS